MRENSCRFDTCRKKYLDREYDTLDDSQREHVRRYHRHATYAVSLNEAMFLFRRDPLQHNEYVCVCGTLFSSYYSLKPHVLGSKRKKYTQVPCPEFSDKAIEVARSKDVCFDDKKPINYYPSEFIQPDDQDKQDGMEIILDAPNQLDEIIDEETDNGDEIVDEDVGDSDENDDCLEALERKERTLNAAIQVLEQTRNDVRKQLRKARKNKW